MTTLLDDGIIADMSKRRRVIGTIPEVIEQVGQRLGRELRPSLNGWLLKNDARGGILPASGEPERTLHGQH